MPDQGNEMPPESQSEPAAILNYGHHSLPTAPGTGRRVAMFVAGLFSGIFGSAIAYGVALGAVGRGSLIMIPIMIPIVLAGKIYWAVQLKQSTSWRGFGSGLITSIGLIVLLVGACFGVLATTKF